MEQQMKNKVYCDVYVSVKKADVQKRFMLRQQVEDTDKIYY